MKAFLLDQLIRPMIHRLGTAAGVFLSAEGLISGDQAATVESGLVLIGGVALDLIIRKVL